MLLEDELARDDVDLFGLIGLIAHLFERPFAHDADAVGVIEHVLLYNDAKLLLLAWAVSLLRSALLRLCTVLAGTSLRALAEEHSVLLFELRLQRLDLDLQCDAVVPLRSEQRARQLRDARDKAAILGLEKNGCLTQHFGIVFALKVDRHDVVVMIDVERGRKSEASLRSERDARPIE